MTIFRPVYKPPTDRVLPQTPGLVEMLRRITPLQYGLPATEQDALTHSAVYQCVNLIANTVAAFPADVYRKDPSGFPTLVTDRRPIVDQPSTEVDPINWRRQVVASWLLRGNAYGLVSGMRGAYPTGIELVHPDRVSVDRVRPDAPTQFYLDREPIDRWPMGRLWHAPGVVLTPGQPLGMSVLQQAMADVGLGLAARKFASGIFTAGGIPTAVFMNDKPVNEDGSKRVKARVLEAMAGTREPLVMGDGWKYQQISISPEESQFLATTKANKSDVAGYFGVPGEFVGGDKSSMTYSNVEGRGIDLLRFCINWWVVLMDQALSQLLVRPEYVKLDVDDLLRADMQTRYSSYAEGIRAGFLSPDDVRAREGYKPIPDGKGDQYNWPPYANKDQNTQQDAAADSTLGAVP